LSKHTSGVNNGWTWSITGYLTTPTGVLFYGPGGGSVNAIGTKTITTGCWHMVTSVYTYSTQQLKIYIDGVLDNTTSSIVSPNGAITSALNIGRDSAGSGYYFDGSLDDIRVYAIALNSTQIGQLYTAKY
ncbi:MAG: LamG domain-containing protein, partial [Bacteroidetes bacterium]|nr:LamG domain-containing protein [Bacteroidota bacterium]